MYSERDNYFNLQGDNSNLTNIQVGDELTFTTGGQHSVDDMVFVFKIDPANDEVVLVNLQKDIFFNSVTPTLTRINDTKPETSKFNNVNVDGIVKDGDGWVISPTLQEEFCKVSDESWTSSLVSSANQSNKGLAYTTDELGYTTSLKSITNCELETRANDSFLLLTFNTLSISQMESLGFNATSDTAQTTTISEVPPTPTSGLTDDDGNPISIFSDVETKFTRYLDLVDQVAQELTTAKGELNTLNELCGKDKANENACTTAAELKTYVEDLQGDLETLTNENTTLDAFRDSVISKLSDVQDEDGKSIITAESSDEQIIKALTDKISGLETKIIEKDNSIEDLNTDILALEADIVDLEGEVTTALTTLSANATTTGETAILRVKDALNQIDVLYDDIDEANSILSDTLNDIKTAISSAYSNVDTLKGSVDESLTDEDGNVTANAKQYAESYIAAIENYISTLKTDNANALSDAEDAYDAAVLELKSTQSSALAAQLAAYNASIDEEALKLTNLQNTVNGYQTNLDEAINSLVESEDITSGEGINLSNLASQWETALKNYNSKVEDYKTLLTEKGNLETSSAVTSQELEDVKSELLIANNTISSQESRLTEMLESLNEVNEELGNFKTLSNTMEEEISSLENVLTELGYTPVTQTESFNGGGISDIFGAEPTEIQHLLFRGIEARKAYLNMSGDGKNDFSSNDVDTLDFNADGSDIKTNGLLKIGLIAGLLYVGSKLLKK